MKKITFLLFCLCIVIVSCSKDESAPQKQFELELSSEPMAGGFLSPKSGLFKEGQELQIRAEPSEGYVFSHWKEDLSGSENPIDLVMNENKNITAVFLPETSVFRSQILGKWDVEGSGKSERSSPMIKQNSGSDCRIFSIVFNTDGTFIINFIQEEIRGNFMVDSVNSIVLEDIGRLENVEVDGEKLSFVIDMEGFCETAGEAKKDINFSEGDCISFLDCNDNTVWVTEKNGEKEFLQFHNNLRGVWIETYTFDIDRNCKISDITNESTQEQFMLQENNVNSLVYLHRKEGVDIRTTYILREDGILEISFETSNDTYYKYFEASSSADLNSYINWSACIEFDAEIIFSEASNAEGVALHGDYLYIAAPFENSIYRIKWAVKNPVPELFITDISMPRDLKVQGDFLFVSLNPNWGSEKIVKIDLTLAGPIIQDIIEIKDPVGLAIKGTKLYISTSDGILEIDFENPEPTSEILSTKTGRTTGLSIIDNYLYATQSGRILRWNLELESKEEEIVLNDIGGQGITGKIENTIYFVNYMSSPFLINYNIGTESFSKIKINLNFDPLYTFATPWSIVGNEDYLFISAYEGGAVIRVKLKD